MIKRLPKELEELQGYVELGMQKLSLQLARQLLKQPTVPPHTFNEVLDAILVHADQLRRWRPLVEAVHSKFRAKQKRLVRNAMFHFYVGLDEFGVALSYMPPKPRDALDLLFCMWTLLHLRYMDSADTIAERIKRIWKKPQSEFDISCVLEAIGSFLAQNGWLEEAEGVWKQAVCYEWFEANAWKGLIHIEVVKALGLADDALKRISVRQPDYDPKLPRNEEAFKLTSLKEFGRIKQSLNRVLPEKELWRFGK
ncbi:MAG: hypothetical protein ABIP71_10265 [Verrucomicrobiota bacterium]